MTNFIEQDPMKQALLMMAHVEKASIKEKEEKQTHEPKKHDMGFSLSFETPNGIISLWSCWLGDQLYIGYPKEWTVSDELIKESLHVHDAAPVAYKKWVRGDVYEESERQWAKFYGEKVEEGGRVWVNHSETHSNGRIFHLIQEKALKTVYRGHDESKNIYNIGFSYFNAGEPEAPNATEKAVQVYRDHFIQLALQIAKDHGGIQAIHAQYEFTVLTPALLETEGYTDIHYVKGNPDHYDSFGGTVVYAQKENEEIILKSGNSLVPWSNVRKVNVTEDVTLENIINDILVF